MEISALDFFLINLLSYIGGLGTGLIVCCRHKDNSNTPTVQYSPAMMSTDSQRELI